jgi:TPR repeat protein
VAVIFLGIVVAWSLKDHRPPLAVAPPLASDAAEPEAGEPSWPLPAVTPPPTPEVVEPLRSPEENARLGSQREREGNDAEASRLYRLAADQGDARAQTSLGVFYELGLGGLARDEQEAARLYRLAADQGDARAQTNLGDLYERGRGGLVQDDREAARLYRLAADQGDAWTQYKLGRFYELGRGGLAKDFEAAVHWYQQAARAGEVFAQDRLRSLGRTW